MAGGWKRPDTALRNKSLESKENLRVRFLKDNPAKRLDVRKKISEKRGHRNFRNGILHSEDTKIKMRKSRLKFMSSGKYKFFKNTSIEILIEEELKKRNIYYIAQVPLCEIAMVDFFIPEIKTVIQCDGDYWHKYPLGLDRDRKQDIVLRYNGFNVYRFWERDIKKSPKECIDKIISINKLLENK